MGFGLKRDGGGGGGDAAGAEEDCGAENCCGGGEDGAGLYLLPPRGGLGFAAGGAYDVYARILSRYLPKYLPGSPTVVVQNMPGAAAMTAANHT